ncbi:hypothetical protein HAP48_0042690 [Bradyrhizobium septentrionale]|uniref:Uncharacterized protein n=1 Tax=Bradyrhizobium septentrionale TaxID=1404411 RepID=A0A973W2I0_9BRAD|nr:MULTISPECIES: hypothetical protein [Bradyrhizobium]MCK7669183.1 hypothetical protein [Bradyrhizobium sp. 2S1]UGY15166.1 hypothetical protein HAP48_0042690 [Bradyrhizobium septentrionale]
MSNVVPFTTFQYLRLQHEIERFTRSLPPAAPLIGSRQQRERDALIDLIGFAKEGAPPEIA